jgi:hypothetical protein
MLRLFALLNRLRCVLTLSGVGLLATGCATLNGNSLQTIHLQTVDAQGQPVLDMSCRLSNDAATYVGMTPLFNMQVRRSALPLTIECQRPGFAMARAVLMPRADYSSAAQLLLPGGTSFMVVDHFTGYMYAYPSWVRLQVGADMVFDQRDDIARKPTPGVVTRQFDDLVRFAAQTPSHHE